MCLSSINSRNSSILRASASVPVVPGLHKERLESGQSIHNRGVSHQLFTHFPIVRLNVVINLLNRFKEVLIDLICLNTLEITVRPGNRCGNWAGQSTLSGFWAILLVCINNTRIKLVYSNFSDLSRSSNHIFSYIHLWYLKSVPAHWTVPLIYPLSATKTLQTLLLLSGWTEFQ